MARPRIGIFSALFAIGGMLAWRWAQNRRAAQAATVRDLTRWEGEGGSVSADRDALQPATLPGGTHPRAGNGADHAASGGAWPFPRS
ncbi:hypothetical protein QYH69_29625 [Paraburkholderia sp. SARCC-3016]|uniref:hypothetical protein n=1 Tax=Paraburkholderia sp. SARCC-3016 TaxID=3058611 RepID=UPI002808980E|nr:hypothetical protein [Paraburkholderia sp. SARCC-3016]MDQ7981396.1 hypothetical protein [Paraburkholderia sp. SARCC-3016]